MSTPDRPADTGSGPRVAPLSPRQWPPEMREALAALQVDNPRHPFPEPDPSRPKALNLLGLLAHHPELTRAYHTFNGHVLFSTTLSPRQRELLVLRLASVRGAEYEWRQHVVLAIDAGLTGEEIDRTAQGPDAPGWSDADRALLRAVDELVSDARISTDTWEALRADLDTRQLLDLVFTVGAYDLLAMVMRSFDVQIDDDLANWRPPSA